MSGFPALCRPLSPVLQCGIGPLVAFNPPFCGWIAPKRRVDLLAKSLSTYLHRYAPTLLSRCERPLPKSLQGARRSISWGFALFVPS